MSYYVVGQMIVERKTPDEGEEVGEYEVLDSVGFSDVLLVDTKMEIEDTIFDDSDVPEEPGVYCIMYAAKLTGVQDYWGEYDVDVDVQWSKVTRYTDEDAKAIIDDITGAYDDSDDLDSWGR